MRNPANDFDAFFVASRPVGPKRWLRGFNSRKKVRIEEGSAIAYLSLSSIPPSYSLIERYANLNVNGVDGRGRGRGRSGPDGNGFGTQNETERGDEAKGEIMGKL